MSAALNILNTVFGYPQFRGQQEAIISGVIEGNDALVLMPTGGGKSLCYQIPALVREGVGVVISPLIALMQDQVNTLQQLGIRAALLNSTLTSEQTRDIELKLKQGDIDLLYIAPERLAIESTQRFLKTLSISLIEL